MTQEGARPKNAGKAPRPSLRLVITAAIALLVLAFLETPMGQASFLADPDRAMLDLAYTLRRNEVRAPAPPVVYLRIDDVSIADYWQRRRGTTLFPPDASSSQGSALASTPPSTPRGLVANLLDTARASQGRRRARIVMLDVDVAWTAHDEEGEAQLVEALRSWSQDPEAPLLVIARETAPAAARRDLTSGGGARLLPPAPSIDAIVRDSPNIVYAIVSFQFDPSGRAREYDIADCAITPDGPGVLPSAVSAIEAANMAVDARSAKSVLRARLARWNAACAARSFPALPRPSTIAYHFAVGPSYERRLAEGTRAGAAPVDGAWRDATVCGEGRPSASWIAADELLDAHAARASLADIMCGAIVVIGGSTSLQPDEHLTPYGRMDGALILANAARGRLITGDMSAPLKRALHISFQIISVLLTVWIIHFAFRRIRRARDALEPEPGAGKRPNLFLRRLGRVATHPLTLGWLAPIFIFFVGAIFSVVTLQFGFWGTLAVPAFSASMAETLFEWEAELDEANDPA